MLVISIIRIDWDDIKMLKSKSHAYRRRVAESFLKNQKARLCNVIIRNDSAIFLLFMVCLSLINNVFFFFTTLFT